MLSEALNSIFKVLIITIVFKCFNMNVVSIINVSIMFGGLLGAGALTSLPGINMLNGADTYIICTSELLILVE